MSDGLTTCRVTRSSYLFRVLSIATVAVVAMALQSCGGEETIPTTSTSVKADSGSGFSHSTPDGVTVTGAPGVAPPDTEVSITTASRPQPELPNGLSYIGLSVEIVIGTGLQPGAPIAVSVPIPPALNGDVAGLIGYTVHEGVPSFLPVTVADGMIHATMTQLSWLDFFKVDFSKFAGAIGEAIKKLMTGESSDAPDCLEQPVTLDGVTYTAERTKLASGGNLDAVWPCLTAGSGALELTLMANGNRAWLARTEPDVGAGFMADPNSNAAAASGLFKTFYAIGSRSTGTLMPGTSLTFTFPGANPPERAEVRVDAGLMLTSALVYEVMAIYDFTGMNTFDRMDDVPGAWDCLNGVTSTFNSRDGNFIDNFASAYFAVLDCMSTVAPGPLQFLLNAIGGGAQIVSGMLTSAWSEITQGNHGYIRIQRSEEPRADGSVHDDYVQQWTGHTRQMTINADGYADITLFSGAMNGEQWQARWTTTDEGIEVTLTSRTSVTGDGLGDLQDGTTWRATLQRAADGPTVMHFIGEGEDLSDPGSGFFWCSDSYGYSSVCGA